jgi:hypothetical protein
MCENQYRMKIPRYLVRVSLPGPFARHASGGNWIADETRADTATQKERRYIFDKIRKEVYGF